MDSMRTNLFSQAAVLQSAQLALAQQPGALKGLFWTDAGQLAVQNHPAFASPALHTSGASLPLPAPFSLADLQLQTEAEMLRQHKNRLETRLQTLERHNEQLEQQLEKIRRLLAQHQIPLTAGAVPPLTPSRTAALYSQSPLTVQPVMPQTLANDPLASGSFQQPQLLDAYSMPRSSCSQQPRLLQALGGQFSASGAGPSGPRFSTQSASHSRSNSHGGVGGGFSLASQSDREAGVDRKPLNADLRMVGDLRAMADEVGRAVSDLVSVITDDESAADDSEPPRPVASLTLFK